MTGTRTASGVPGLAVWRLYADAERRVEGSQQVVWRVMHWSRSVFCLYCVGPGRCSVCITGRGRCLSVLLVVVGVLSVLLVVVGVLSALLVVGVLSVLLVVVRVLSVFLFYFIQYNKYNTIIQHISAPVPTVDNTHIKIYMLMLYIHNRQKRYIHTDKELDKVLHLYCWSWSVFSLYVWSWSVFCLYFGRGRCSVCIVGRGRCSVCIVGRGRCSVCTFGRGRCSVCTVGRGWCSVCTVGRGRCSVCIVGRGRCSVCIVGRGRCSVCTVGRGRCSVGTVGRGSGVAPWWTFLALSSSQQRPLCWTLSLCRGTSGFVACRVCCDSWFCRWRHRRCIHLQ